MNDRFGGTKRPSRNPNPRQLILATTAQDRRLLGYRIVGAMLELDGHPHPELLHVEAGRRLGPTQMRRQAYVSSRAGP